MILSIAHATADEAEQTNVYGAWSDLVVGDRPDGLVDSYLVQDDGVVQIVAVWRSQEDHDQALGDEAVHPAYVVFEAAGLDPTHTVFKVVGTLHQH